MIMSEPINWCDLKKNIKHIGEVSTSHQDGKPTGAEILTSTNEVTNQVRDTLEGKLRKMDAQFQDRFATLTPIEWAEGINVTNPLQVYKHTVAGVERTYLPDPAQIPFTTEATFAEDEALNRWVADDVLTRMKQWRDVGDVRGWSNGSTEITDAVKDAIGLTKAVKIPIGVFTASIDATDSARISGCSMTHTVIQTPTGSSGLSSSSLLRGTVLENFTLSAKTSGDGIGIDTRSGMVNCNISNINVNKYDIGWNTSNFDFSNVLTNVRANQCRVSFKIEGRGQFIQNTLRGLYSSQPTELGMDMAGVKGLVIDGYNSGSNGEPHVRIGLNSTGVVFNSPNFENDTGGKLALGGYEVLVGSASEVIFNSPVFAKSTCEGGGYLMRIRDAAVVTINNPSVISEGTGITHHLSVEGTATVYLNDPVNQFTKITVAPTAKLIRVYDKLSSTPDSVQVMTLSDAQVISTDRRVLHATAEINTRVGGGAYPTAYAKLRIVFDSYSGGTVRARFIDTTTGAALSSVANVPCFVQLWYTELPV